jgi:allantoin racemase
MATRTVALVAATSGYTSDELEHRRTLLQRHLPPGCVADADSVSGGPEFLDRGSHFADAGRAAVEYFSGLGSTAWDVVIWAGAIDPALSEIRSVSPVPVVGPGEASMFVAAVIGKPLTVVTVDEHAVRNTHTMLDGLVVKPPIASVRSMDVPVRRIMSDREGARRALHREIQAAVDEDGAAAVYLGAMTLGTLGVDDLRRSLPISILSPIEVAAAVAGQLALALPTRLPTEYR